VRLVSNETIDVDMLKQSICKRRLDRLLFLPGMLIKQSYDHEKSISQSLDPEEVNDLVQDIDIKNLIDIDAKSIDGKLNIVKFFKCNDYKILNFF